MEHLKSMIRHVPDFPKPGILFYDITTLLQDGTGLHQAIDSLSTPFTNAGIEVVVGIESRGFIFGSAVADRLSRVTLQRTARAFGWPPPAPGAG